MFSAWIVSSLAEGPAIRSLESDSPGDRRVVDANSEGLDQAAIRRNVVPLLQEDDVARDEPVCEQPDRLTIAQHLDLLRQQPAQRGQRSFDPEFLPEGKQPADQDNGQDRVTDLRHAMTRIAPFGHKGQARGEPQDQGEKVSELLQEAQQYRFARDCFHPIEAILAEPAQGLDG